MVKCIENIPHRNEAKKDKVWKEISWHFEVKKIKFIELKNVDVYEEKLKKLNLN